MTCQCIRRSIVPLNLRGICSDVNTTLNAKDPQDFAPRTGTGSNITRHLCFNVLKNWAGLSYLLLLDPGAAVAQLHLGGLAKLEVVACCRY